MREPKVAGSRLPGSTHDLITATISVELVLDAKACMSAAAQNQTPSWPSLYDPLLEFHDLEHHAPEQPGGHYLTHAGGKLCPSLTGSGRLTHRSNPKKTCIDVFRFTLYWMLIFFSLFFLTTGGIACFNIIYPARRDNDNDNNKNGILFSASSLTGNRAPELAPESHTAIPLTPLTSARSPDLLLPEVPGTVDAEERRAPQPRKNVRRSRITYALFTLLAFLVTALAASFIWSAVVGYVLYAVFTAGDFNIST